MWSGININVAEEKLRNKSCWSAGEGLLSTEIYITRMGWFMHWQQGVELPFFANFFGQKTEINHGVENLYKIRHHMWHWGHKCNCFGDLSVIVAGSQLGEFLKYPNVHYSQTCICVYLSAIVEIWEYLNVCMLTHIQGYI